MDIRKPVACQAAIGAITAALPMPAHPGGATHAQTAAARAATIEEIVATLHL